MEKITSIKDVISITSEYTTSEKDIQKCLNRLQKITDVPTNVANEFSEQYEENGNITMYKSVKNLIEYINQNKQK